MSEQNQTNNKLLPYDLSGKVTSPNLIVFLHGYPDNNRLWDNIFPAHEKENLVLRMSYPNYDKRMQEKWGRTFPDIIKGIKATIDHVKEDRDYKIFFVAHDWGAYITYLFDKTYPNFINNGITMDIGYKFPQSPGILIRILSYQIYLALAFILPAFIGNFMTSLFVQTFVVTKGHADIANIDEIDASMNYMYYYAYRTAFFQTAFFIVFFFLTETKLVFYSLLVLFMIYKVLTLGSSNPLAGYKPSFPLGYLYGEKKPFHFHNNKMLDYLKAKEKCEVIEVANRGHWLMVDNEKQINEIITRRLKDM